MYSLIIYELFFTVYNFFFQPNMEVVSDDRSTHNQYHGGQGSREFVHEYRDSDSPQDSPPAQTGRPQSAAFSPRKLSSVAMEELICWHILP